MSPRELIEAFQKNRDYKHFAQTAVDLEMIPRLLELCLTEGYPYPQYSSWLLAHIAENHKNNLATYFPQIIDVFLAAKDHSVQRNIANVLLKFPVTDYREGELLDQLFRFLQDSESKVALKAYCMYLIVPFLKNYPELKGELKAIIEEGMQKESPAYAGAAKKTLRAISKK